MILRRDLILLTFILCIVYISNIGNSFTTRDSAEFLQVGQFLDISHSPGAPLYGIFAKIAFFIGKYRGINFLSFVFIIISFYFAYKISLKLNINIFVIFCFYLLYSVRYYGVISEIYSINLCFFTIAIYYFLIKNNKNLFFTLGLLCTITPINIVFIIPFFLFKLNELKQNKKIILLFLLPLLLWFYIPIRSINNPPLDYGNADNLINTINHIRGKDFKVASNVLDFSKDIFLLNIKQIASNLLKRPESYVFLAGFIFFIKRKDYSNKNILYFLFSVFLIFIVFFILLSLRIEHSTHFLIPGFFSLYIIMGIFISKSKFLIIISFFILFFVNIFPFNIDNSEFVNNFTNNIIDSIEQPAIFFTSIDNRNFYFQFMDNSKLLKKDIIFINMLNLKDKWYLKKLSKKINIPQIESDNIEFNLNSIIELNKNSKNIYFDLENPNYNVYSQGLIYQLEKTSFSNKDIINKICNIPKKNISLYNDPELYNIMISYDIMFNKYLNINKYDENILKEYNKWQEFYTGDFY